MRMLQRWFLFVALLIGLILVSGVPANAAKKGKGEKGGAPADAEKKDKSGGTKKGSASHTYTVMYKQGNGLWQKGQICPTREEAEAVARMVRQSSPGLQTRIVKDAH